MSDLPFLSVVIPAYNEQENIQPLLDRLEAALSDIDGDFEVLIVDDGSTDRTPDLLQQGMARYPWLRVLRLHPNSGQTAAFDAGFRAARGRMIATLDADLQNDPAEIPRLLPFLAEWDMVTGWRQARCDSAFRRFQTRIANRIRNWITHETIHDSACSLKVYRRECLQDMPLFSGMHRFLPTLVKMRGFRVMEIPVSHAPRHAGTAKYGIGNRIFRTTMDLLAVRWMQRRFFRYHLEELGATPLRIDRRGDGALERPRSECEAGSPAGEQRAS